MKKCQHFLLVILAVFLLMAPMTVSADIGPKPSVVIEFKGLEEEEYYVTLLSEKKSTGPYSLGNPYYDYMGDEAVFNKFSEYEDENGYYFLSYMEECSEEDIFKWTYYPPFTFKILIYFPEYNKFLAPAGIYERYAFDSYFTVEVSGVENIVVSCGAGAVETDTYRSYDFTMELVSLAARVVLTVLVEIGIALLFWYRSKKPLLVITGVNIVTQVILNVLLNIFNYTSGHYAFVFHYVWMELVVFALEAVIYARVIGCTDPATNRKYHPIWYAFMANTVSFIAGMWIARTIPGIF